jgi:hypothetical protein
MPDRAMKPTSAEIDSGTPRSMSAKTPLARATDTRVNEHRVFARAERRIEQTEHQEQFQTHGDREALRGRLKLLEPTGRSCKNFCHGTRDAPLRF